MAELNCRFVRPDRLLFEGPVRSVVLATYEGELCILPGHSSEICALGDGVVRLNKLEEDGGQCRRIVISGGYAEVDAKGVVVLADHARALDDIDVTQVQATKDEATNKMNELPEQDARRAYYINKIKWCDLLLRHAHDEIGS